MAVKAICLIIGLYQRLISPFTPRACRYAPSCSQFALEAFRRYGVFKGLYLSLGRLLRCHPFFSGGYDPVP